MVRSAMMHRANTWKVRNWNEKKLNQAEMRIWNRKAGLNMERKNKWENESGRNIQESTEIKWYGHVMEIRGRTMWKIVKAI